MDGVRQPRRYGRFRQDAVSLIAVETEARSRFSVPFLDCSEGQQDEILAEMALNEKTPETDLQRFFGVLKAQTITGYYASRVGLIQEVGTCRMSADPKTGVLDPYCRMHDVKNVYVFGGGPFVTSGTHHPTLTMMALTVRGCEHLVQQANARSA